MNNTIIKISFCRAKMTLMDISSSIRRRRTTTIKLPHISGYNSGNSPNTDILPVIDINGHVIRPEKRSLCEKFGYLHPTVHLHLYNSQGHVLVQKRSLSKAESPGLLAQSVGGHVPFGLSIEDTLKKETYEEIGVKLTTYNYLGSYLYRSQIRNTTELVYIYDAIYDGRIRPNYSELCWAGYFDPIAIFNLSKTDPRLFSSSYTKDLAFLKTKAEDGSISLIHAPSA